MDETEAVFLIRPPQTADAKTFDPFLTSMLDRNIRCRVLLSVKGADRCPLLPHHLEKAISRKPFKWTSLGPRDFMQKLETVHRQAIRQRNERALLLGQGSSAFIDIYDIGQAAAKVLLDDNHGD